MEIIPISTVWALEDIQGLSSHLVEIIDSKIRECRCRKFVNLSLQTTLTRCTLIGQRNVLLNHFVEFVKDDLDFVLRIVFVFVQQAREARGLHARHERVPRVVQAKQDVQFLGLKTKSVVY
jgi:hypothetical protein